MTPDDPRVTQGHPGVIKGHPGVIQGSSWSPRGSPGSPRGHPGHKGGYLGSVRGRRVSERETDSQSKYLSQSVRENRAYRAPPEEELKMGALLYIYSAFMFYNMHGKNFNKTS